MIRPALKEGIEQAIAELDRVHKKGQCLLGCACPIRNTIHRLRDELHAEDAIDAAGLSETLDWHPVAEQLPDTDETVMIANPAWSEPVWMGYWDSADGVWRSAEGLSLDVEQDNEAASLADLKAPLRWAPMPKGGAA